jgi:GNAT superfamily N-acetyltransferase
MRRTGIQLIQSLISRDRSRVVSNVHELSGGLILRKARAEDLVGIIALLVDDPVEAERQARCGGTYQRYSASFAAVDHDPQHELIVVTAPGGNRVLATAHLVVIPGLSWQGMARAQLQGFRVAEDARGHGIGRQVLSWAQARARERGCGFIQVVTDKRRHDAHRFYYKWGFKSTHDGLKLWLSD